MDKEKTREIKDRFEEAEKEANERARRESEELQRQRALARGPPSPKRKAGRKKMNLTEEEKKERAKKQKKAYYDRVKQKRKSQAQLKVGGAGVEGSSRDKAQEERIAPWEGGESMVVFEGGRPTKERQVQVTLEEASDAESSLDD